MKGLLIGLLALASFSAFASEKLDINLSKALEKSGVSKTGHRHYQSASIVCRIPKGGNDSEPFCDIENKNFSPTTTQYLEGGKLAKRISSLLTEAGVYPTGHRDYQAAEIVCRVPKFSTTGIPLCDIDNLNGL